MQPLDLEIRQSIQKIADTNNIAVIGFVAPQDAVRVSPVSFASASIAETEMYKLEEIVNEIKARPNPPEILHIIIQTPGGELYTSYKIAYYLRASFKDIKAFVPYQAASGGTLICCAANEIYLGELGNLTPIDPQVRYNNNRVSAYAFERTVDKLNKLFGERMPAEVPTPWQQMAEKIDPVIYDEMHTAVFNTFLYARQLLEKSGYSEKEALTIAMELARPKTTHSHPILSDSAKNEFGLHIGKNDDIIGIIKSYTKYVSCRLKEKSTMHIIDHFSPQIYESTSSTTTHQTKNTSDELSPQEW